MKILQWLQQLISGKQPEVAQSTAEAAPAAETTDPHSPKGHAEAIYPRSVKQPMTYNHNTENMTQPTLYALCVGINDYQYVPKLGGCVPDATNVYNYLARTSANTDFKFSGKMLLDAEATKANVVEAFKQHLGQAKPGDVAFFYFSGHGAEEDADAVFWDASQKKTLNTIVCYDSRSPQGITDLADKELRYLIHGVTGDAKGDAAPHFVLIMDSCHSGDVTRDAELIPRLTERGNPRQWSDFIFADKISRDAVAAAPSLKNVLPQGQHIHFSSCEGSELAYEVGGSGVFTSTLLEVLSRTSGKISYSDLHNRLRYYIKGRFPQSPTIYAVEGEASDMNMEFLGGASAQNGLRGNVLFNTKERRWLLDLGAIHGIPSQGYESVEVMLLDGDQKPLAPATIAAVTPDNCTLLIDSPDVDIRESYTASVKGIYRELVGFYLDMETDLAAMNALDSFLREDAEELAQAHNIKTCDTLAAAQFLIHVQDGQYIISKAEDSQRRPIVLQQPITNGAAMMEILGYMKSIARYDFVMKIDNPRSQLTAGDPSLPAAGIEVYRVHDEQDRSKDERLSANADHTIMLREGDLISVRTANNTRRHKLYFAMLYADQRFGIDASTLGETAQEMNPGEELWYDEKAAFEAFHEDFILDFQFKATQMTFKLIASTETFSARTLSQGALPQPVLPGQLAEVSDTRALRRRTAPSSADWTTYTLHLVIENPQGR